MQTGHWLSCTGTALRCPWLLLAVLAFGAVSSPVAGQTVARISLSPVSVAGGTISNGTVSLSAKAGGAGATVSLSSSNAAATTPASITIPSGAKSATFVITTTPVSSIKTASILATLGRSTAKATLTITAPKLTSLSFNPTDVPGGAASTGTVKLGSAAPAGGMSVTFSSGSKAWGGPASVLIPGGSSSASFTCKTSPVTATQKAVVTAKAGGSSVNATLTIEAAALSGVSLSPSSLGGGASSTGTVTLTGPAPAAGFKIGLACSQSAASVPKSVTVPSGATTATFGIPTTQVSKQVSAKITATLSGKSTAATLTISPLTISGLMVNPTSLIGGSASTGTVSLNGPAPSQGLTVTITSSQSTVTVLQNVTVSAGVTSATFSIATQPVSTLSTATITAVFASTSLTATLTVDPPSLTGVAVSPTTLLGGGGATGTLTLNGPAPASGLGVTLTSDQAAISVPSSVIVSGGASSATFTVTTVPVASQTVATIKAALGSSSFSTTLMVNSPSLIGFSLNPTSLTAGTTSSLTVTLDGPAPSAGYAIALSSNQTSATVPGTVTIPAEALSTTATVTTISLSKQTLATITGTDPNGKSLTAALTILPQLVQTVQLPVNDIAYDPISGNIWAAVQSTGGQYANSVIAINPATGAIGTVINMGAEPNHIAVTDDGEFAYVDVPEDGSIRRANLKLGTAGAVFATGFPSVFDLEAVPGSPHSYLVATDPNGGFNASVWDDGVRRQGTGGGGYDVRFAGSSSLLYGDGGNQYFTNTLDSTEIVCTASTQITVSGFVWANNLLFTAVPNVVDPINKYVVESIPTNDFLSAIIVATNTSDNRIYYATWDGTHNKRILSFDLSTYSEYPLFDTGIMPGGAEHLISCGNHTVAFFLYGSGAPQEIVIVRGLP